MTRTLSLFLALSMALLAFAQDENMTEDKKSERKEDGKKSSKNEISDILESMGYPELQVVPRASERLGLEARAEDSTFLFTHWPIELSALTTLYVGMTAKGRWRTDLTVKEKKDATTISAATSAVGAGWLIGAIIVGAQRPYHVGQKAINKYTGKDERSTLLRERLAEEALERPAKTMRMLQTLAVISNASVNVATAIHANESGTVMAGIGVLLAFLPWMFEDHNISVYDKHIEYKKKIYAPLRSASLSFDPVTRTVTPVTQLTWTF